MKKQMQFVPDGYEMTPKLATWKTIMILVFSATGGAVWLGLAFLALANLASKIAGY